MKFFAILFLFGLSAALQQYPNENFAVFSNQNAEVSILTDTLSVSWYVNGLTVNYGALVRFTGATVIVYNNGSYNYTLIINKSFWQWNDRARVSCETPRDNCKTVTIKPQRELDFPLVRYDVQENLFRWTDPNTLDVLNVDPDLWYMYFGVDTTTGEYTCCNLYYVGNNATCNEVRENHAYYFEVIPVNNVGVGAFQPTYYGDQSADVYSSDVISLYNNNRTQHVVNCINGLYLPTATPEPTEQHSSIPTQETNLTVSSQLQSGPTEQTTEPTTPTTEIQSTGPTNQTITPTHLQSTGSTTEPTTDPTTDPQSTGPARRRKLRKKFN